MPQRLAGLLDDPQFLHPLGQFLRVFIVKLKLAGVVTPAAVAVSANAAAAADVTNTLNIALSLLEAVQRAKSAGSTDAPAEPAPEEF